MEFLMNNLFLLPMGTAVILSLLGMSMNNPNKKPKELPVYDALKSSFDNYLSNAINELSYKPPFVWLMPENPEDEKARNIDAMINKAGFQDKMNYRVLQTSQVLLLILAVIATLVFGVFVDNSKFLFKILMNIDIEGGMTTFVAVGVIMLLLAFVPRIYIKFKADGNHAKFISELPILQLFIILMIRSRRTVPEIFYTLSKSEMRYKPIFERAYRIFLRDRRAAFVYLRGAFDGTPITDSISVLETFDEYSKEESAQILDNQLTSIVDQVATLKKNRNVLLGLVTEGSIMLPFAAIMLLVVTPIVIYGLNSMNAATNMGMAEVGA